MTTPQHELPRLEFQVSTNRSSDDDSTAVEPPPRLERSVDSKLLHDRLKVETRRDLGARFEEPRPSPSQTREEAHRLDDELAMQRVERLTSSESRASADGARTSTHLHRSRSRNPEPVDEFDAATNPIHERAAIYKPP